MTASSSTEVEVINALSLLAHKVAPNVFDLSSLQWHVSIRDQIVRAQLLMTDLKAANPKINSVLIVGMGAAGISAAMTACELGIPQVCVVDKADAPFKLFRGVTSRFVGPFMYEWPSSFHADQSYPKHPSTPWGDHGSSYLQWSAESPISADHLAKELTASFSLWMTDRKKRNLSVPHLLAKADPAEIQSFAKKFAVAESARAKETENGGREKTFKAEFKLDDHADAMPWGGTATGGFPQTHEPDYLVLAAGMGTETLTVPGSETTPSFWANDTLKDASTADQRVVVLGGGDGALQDALRVLTTHDHPLSLMQDLQRNPSAWPALSAELPALLDADRQMRQYSAWAKVSQGQAMVDRACRTAAEKMATNRAVRRCVLGSIRPGKGTVLLCVAGAHFDKAYLLNRFAIHLLAACYQKRARRPAGRIAFKVQFNARVTNATPPSPTKANRWTLHVTSQGLENEEKADKVVVRFGVQRDTIPGLQMVQIGVPNERDLKQRATLKGIELPFVAIRDL